MREKTWEVGGGGWNLFKGGNMEVLGEEKEGNSAEIL